jgi:DNA-binding beta-propeller fold protein YncE
MVLDADWNYLTEFGSAGEGPGEFQIVHSIAMAPGGRILVADRDNNRVQIFNDSDYSYMAEIPVGALALDILVSGNRVFVSDVGPPRLRQFDLDGNPVYTWFAPGDDSPHWIREMHSIGVDSDGNLYAADNQNGRIQKLIPKLDADPNLLVGQPYVPR